MASSSSSPSAYGFLVLFFLGFLDFPKQSIGCLTSIFSFGDSLADTGNLLSISDPFRPSHCFLPPYGETYFQRPTGRCSDGRLVIDFIAEYLGLPLIPPYNEKSADFGKGVNFAVIGATALEDDLLKDRGIPVSYANISLAVQLRWFKEFLASPHSHTSSAGNKFLQSSLVLMGEIGGNDYNYPLMQRRSIEEIKALVPLVVNAIAFAILELIELGAMTIMVPGNLPIGCLPVYLTIYMDSNKEDYDTETGCLVWLNEFSKYHNDILRAELGRIQELHPHATIIYADYYNAAIRLYNSPLKYGFNGTSLRACCGEGGPYNYNSSAGCGNSQYRACEEPTAYINWDGMHFTEATYRWISEGLLQEAYSVPPLVASCASTYSL